MSAARARTQRQPNLGEELAVADRGHERADVELVHADDALARGAADHDRGLECRADRGQVLRGVRLAERAADRAAVADYRIGDHPLGFAEDRKALGQQLGRSSSKCRVSAPIRSSPPSSRM